MTTAVPGGSVTYTLTASSAGPSDAVGATVADDFPASLTCTWTCAEAGGGDCTAAGNGDLNDTVSLPSGGSVTYTASCTISAAATGSLANTATVSAPGGVTDADPDDNSATDTDTLAPQANLSITKTDGVLAVEPGGSTTYTVVAANAGPSHAPGSTVTDDLPSALTCTWTCAEANGGDCTASGSGDISDTVNLPSGGSVTYTVSCTISANATGTITNTATVATGPGVTDPSPGNNSATDVDTLPTIFADGFESGDTSRWSNQVPGGFVVTQEVELSGSAIEFAYDLSRLPANVAFGPAAIAEVVDELGGVAFAVEARRSDATAALELRLVAADGSGLRRTAWLAVAESTQALLLDWQENPPGGPEGRVSLGLDGRSTFSLDGFARASTPPSLFRLLLPE